MASIAAVCHAPISPPELPKLFFALFYWRAAGLLSRYGVGGLLIQLIDECYVHVLTRALSGAGNMP
jgi:hypothetical protein